MRPNTDLDASKGIALGMILSVIAWFLIVTGAMTVWAWLTR